MPSQEEWHSGELCEYASIPLPKGPLPLYLSSNSMKKASVTPASPCCKDLITSSSKK